MQLTTFSLSKLIFRSHSLTRFDVCSEWISVLDWDVWFSVVVCRTCDVREYICSVMRFSYSFVPTKRSWGERHINAREASGTSCKNIKFYFIWSASLLVYELRSIFVHASRAFIRHHSPAFFRKYWTSYDRWEWGVENCLKIFASARWSAFIWTKYIACLPLSHLQVIATKSSIYMWIE